MKDGAKTVTEKHSMKDEVVESAQPLLIGQDATAMDPTKETNSSKPPGSSNRLPSNPTNQNLDQEVNLDHAIDEEELERKRVEQARREELYKELKDILPEIKSLKKWHVATLANNYELCLHPDPLFKRQCILTKNGRVKYDEPLLKYRPYEEKADKRVRISDFSKTRKLRVNDWSRGVREEELQNLQSTTLNSRFMDLRQLFTMSDMHVIVDLVRELDAFVFYRVMPADAETNIPYLNQCVHVVRRQHLIDEMNDCLKGIIAVDRLRLDVLLDWDAQDRSLISDQQRDDDRQAEAEKRQKRQDKIKRIEEKRVRQQARDNAEKERLEAEAKAAEEAAIKEREASRNPAKAAALKIEKERHEKERLEQERINQEKAAQAAHDKLENEKIEQENAAAQIPIEQTQEWEGNLDEDGMSPLKGAKMNHNLLESDIPAIELHEGDFDNPLSASFYQIKAWTIPHKIYRIPPEETPEQLMEAMEYLILALANDHPHLGMIE